MQKGTHPYPGDTRYYKQLTFITVLNGQKSTAVQHIIHFSFNMKSIIIKFLTDLQMEI